VNGERDDRFVGLMILRVTIVFVIFYHGTNGAVKSMSTGRDYKLSNDSSA